MEMVGSPRLLLFGILVCLLSATLTLRVNELNKIVRIKFMQKFVRVKFLVCTWHAILAHF